MFDFLKQFNTGLYRRVEDIEKNISTYNGSVYTTILHFCESSLKLIIENENIFIEKERPTIGDYLYNAEVVNCLEDKLKIKKSIIHDIIKHGNRYKHEDIVDFNKSNVGGYFKYIFYLARAINNEYSNNKVDLEFSQNYYDELLRKNESSKNDLALIYNEDIKRKEEENIKIKKEYEEKIRKEIEEKNRLIKEKEGHIKSERERDLLLVSRNKAEEELFAIKNKLAELEKRRNEDLSQEVVNLKNDYRLKISLLESEKDKTSRKLSIYEEERKRYSSELDRKNIKIQEYEKRISELEGQKYEYLDPNKSKLDQVYNYYRKNVSKVTVSSSYVKNDSSFIFYNLRKSNLSSSKYSSYYAVVNNILQRGIVVVKSDYLSKLELKSSQYKELFRLQILILSLIRNNIFNDKVWNINYINGDKKIIKYAILDIFNRVKLLSKLSKLDYVEPKLVIESNNKELKNFTNIIYSNEITYSKYIFSIYNLDENVGECSLWFSDKIGYKIKDYDKKYLLTLLREIFGHEDFNEGQFDILKNVLNNSSTVGILPTGGGKSLVYLFSTLLQPKISIVIAPTLSLIKDQVDKLKYKYKILRVMEITSADDSKTKYKKNELIRSDQYLYLYISPERLQNKNFRDTVVLLGNEDKVGQIVLDEVHCLSEWGHDFRVAYLMVAHTLSSYCSGIQFIGLTATASTNVVKDLIVELGIQKRDIIFQKKLKRNNLLFKIVEFNQKEELNQYLKDKLIGSYQKDNELDISLKNEETKSFVVFAKTRPECESLEKVFKSCFKNNEVSAYHSTINNKEKIQEDFMNNKKSLLFATKAFGIGIDKPNIRGTFHYGMPSSREDFYQEAGRAGRDRKSATCYILTYKHDDFYEEKIEVILDSSRSVPEIKGAYEDISHINHKDKFDLKTNLFFLFHGLKSPEEESLDLYRSYEKLISFIKNSLMIRGSLRELSLGEDKTSYEKKLHSLHKMGVVNNWTIDYSKSISDPMFNIIINHGFKDIDNIKINTEKYLSLYGNAKNELENLKNINKISEIMFLLKTWHYNTFVRARIEQIANIKDLVETYKNQNKSEEIQDVLEKFFDISNLIDVSSEGYDLRFTDNNIDFVIKKAVDLPDEDIRGRIIEMENLFQNTTSVNSEVYMSLLHLRKNMFDSRNGSNRLLSALNKMDEYEKVELYRSIGQYLFDFINTDAQLVIFDFLYKYNSEFFRNVLLENVSTDNELVKKYFIFFANEKVKNYFN